jgi:uncharacterized protein YlxW (UPF0749 family)
MTVSVQRFIKGVLVKDFIPANEIEIEIGQEKVTIEKYVNDTQKDIKDLRLEIMRLNKRVDDLKLEIVKNQNEYDDDYKLIANSVKEIQESINNKGRLL